MQTSKILLRGDGSPKARFNRYLMITDTVPTREEIIDEQSRLGFDPEGYGDPISVITSKKGDKYETVWSSWATCD
jgi:hypothetical protein